MLRIIKGFNYPCDEIFLEISEFREKDLTVFNRLSGHFLFESVYEKNVVILRFLIVK